MSNINCATRFSERAQNTHAGRMTVIALAAIALAVLTPLPASAQIMVADNQLPSTGATGPSVAAPAPPATSLAVPNLPAAPSAEMQASLNTNPFADSGLAALSTSSSDGQAGNALASNPAPAKSGHRTLALVGGIAGSVVAGFGTVMLVGGAGCNGTCPAKHLGEITLPIGAGVAALGYYYFFHHSN